MEETIEQRTGVRSNLQNDSNISTESNMSIDESSSAKELDSRSIRKVYLITYSQADLIKFPTRRSFADAVIASFSGVSATIEQWCCSQEEHKASGKHYHMAIKFNKNQRWISSKRYLARNNGISVHYSAAHDNYYSAWSYTSKEDKDTLESEGHPDLSNSRKEPKTTQATKKRRLQAKKAACKKRKRLMAFDISEIIIEKGIKSREELLIFAKDQKDQGEKGYCRIYCKPWVEGRCRYSEYCLGNGTCQRKKGPSSKVENAVVKRGS